MFNTACSTLVNLGKYYGCWCPVAGVARVSAGVDLIWDEKKIRWRGWSKYFFMEDRDTFILHLHIMLADDLMTRWFNPLAPGRFEWNFRSVIIKLISVIGAWGISSEIAIRWMPFHLTWLAISQLWFRQWLGAVRQQAITWANVDPELHHHMPPLAHNNCDNKSPGQSIALHNTAICMWIFTLVDNPQMPFEFSTSFITRINVCGRYEKLSAVCSCFRHWYMWLRLLDTFWFAQSMHLSPKPWHKHETEQ